MALRFVDSFDHYATADILTKYTTKVADSGASGVTIGAFGRNSTSGMRFNRTTNSSGVANYVTKTIDAQATWIVGLAWKTNLLPAGTASESIVQFIDVGTLQCDLRFNADGTLSVTRAGTVLGTTSFSVTTGTFYHIEIKVTISDASGVAVVRVNGDTKLSLSGVDTKNTANASANIIRIGQGVGTQNAGLLVTDVDDLYICDGTGSQNNDFLGDVRNEALLPTAAGNYAQWTPSAGSNFQNVDDATPNGDTDYNESSTTGQKDSFAFSDLASSNGSIAGVTVHCYAEKTDAGPRSIRFFIRSGGVDYFSPNFALTTAYLYYSYTWETNPATSSAWLISEVNAIECGYDVVS